MVLDEAAHKLKLSGQQHCLEAQRTKMLTARTVASTADTSSTLSAYLKLSAVIALSQFHPRNDTKKRCGEQV